MRLECSVDDGQCTQLPDIAGEGQVIPGECLEEGNGFHAAMTFLNGLFEGLHEGERAGRNHAEF